MAGLGARDIRRKIKSINSTKQITKAMELTSTAKLRTFRKRFDTTKPYFTAVLRTISEVAASEKGLKHVLTAKTEAKNPLIIVVTSDKGLCGGYNVNVFKETAELVKQFDSYKLITIGKKGKDFFRSRNYEIYESFEHISEKPSTQDANRIKDSSIGLLKNGEIDAIYLVYTKMVSTISQQARAKRLLPMDRSDLDEFKSSRRDESGREVLAEEVKRVSSLTTYDPSPEGVLDMLMPYLIHSGVYGALIESSAAEQAARRNAMESATDSASEMIDSLVLSYNQARQAAITQEITEIVGGANAL